MMPSFALLKLVYLFLVFGKIISERLDFKSGLGNSAWFREGSILELYCKQDSTEDIEISSPTEIIVQESYLVPGMTHRYNYHKNSLANVLIIKRLRREDQGIYTCQEGQSKFFAIIHVLYSPSDKSPQCTSNYDSPVLFDDIRQDYINFSCATEEGNPPVLMTFTVHESENFHNISDLEKLCTVDQNFYNISTFSCHMNESLGNTIFRCDVSQQFPSSYNGNYQDSCSFGPLHFLSNFSIKVSKSYETVKGDVNLTCTTNETGVKIKWIGIPADWEYHVTTSDYTSQVWIKNEKQQSTPDITVQCIGFYGNRNVTDSVTITIEGGKSGINVLIMLLSLVILSIILSITFFLGCYARKQGIYCSLRNQSALDRENSQHNEANTVTMDEKSIAPNKNNANNTSIEICNGDEKSNSDLSNDQLENMMVSNICINPVYESASIAADATVLERNKDQYAVVSKQIVGLAYD